jgi:putative ABC transport system ATP-binding protein
MHVIASDKVGAELFREVKSLFVLLIGKDRSFLMLAVVYGIAISLLTLAVPVSVQMLINSVAHTASVQAVVTLALILLILLSVSGALHAMQTYVMELFERRFYARITSQFVLRKMYAMHSYYNQINRYELANRYFDIMSVQKIVPSLIIGMFSLILQMIVGIVVVSFYHPWLLLFNICFLLALWIIWRIWAYRAIRTAIDLSAAKYNTARHLEDVAMANSFFKTTSRIDFAIDKTDHLTKHYISERIRHFRHTFRQQIALLGLYAIANSGLLGIGGVLVVSNQLTLGQLVAAELILSAVFYGVSRLRDYLVQYYELCASFEEISRVYALPLERLTGDKLMPEGPLDLVFDDARFAEGEKHSCFNFTVPARAKIMASCSGHNLQDLLLHTIKRYREADRGRILIGPFDILDYKLHDLRDQIIVLELPTIVECTIREYLMIGAPKATLSDMNSVLEMVELDERVGELEDGLDTALGVSGIPLTASETLRLKIAGAWLSRPHILVLNEIFDTISFTRRSRIFTRLCQDPEMTVIYFSHRQDLNMFDDYLFIEPHEQRYFGNVAALREYEESHAGMDRD